MKIHRLSLDDAFDDEFHIIALYTDEEDYRLAFLLNEFLSLKLKRSKPLLTKNNKSGFSIFEFDEVTMYRNWFLLQNQDLVEEELTNPLDLFSQNPTLFQQKIYFLKEFKKARYLLKIITDEGNDFISSLIKRLGNIPQIYAVELVDLPRLKNNKILLF